MTARQFAADKTCESASGGIDEKRPFSDTPLGAVAAKDVAAPLLTLNK
jgi:hypothetical protein